MYLCAFCTSMLKKMSYSHSYSQNSQSTGSYGTSNERSFKTLQERSFKVLVVGEKKDDVYAIASLLQSHSYQGKNRH